MQRRASSRPRGRRPPTLFPPAPPVPAAEAEPQPDAHIVEAALAESVDGMRKPTRLRAAGIVGGRAEHWEMVAASEGGAAAPHDPTSLRLVVCHWEY